MSDTKDTRFILDIETTGLDPWYGSRVVLIGLKRFGKEAKCITHRDEALLLTEFWDIFRKVNLNHQMVTMNGYQFDLPFLLARTYIAGLQPDLMLLEQPHFDIMKIIYTRVSSSHFAKLLGVKDKGGSGRSVPKWYREGEYQKIEDYARADFQMIEDIYLKLESMRGVDGMKPNV